MSDLRNIIRQLAQPDGETVALVCTVDEVDKNARTIDCTPINEGAPLLGVNLQANQEADYGFCLFPEKGSFVVVGFVADGAAGVVLLTEKIESAEIVIGDTSAVMDADGLRIKTEKMSADINRENIIFNGGNLNGLVVIQNSPTNSMSLKIRSTTLLQNITPMCMSALRPVPRVNRLMHQPSRLRLLISPITKTPKLSNERFAD